MKGSTLALLAVAAAGGAFLFMQKDAHASGGGLPTALPPGWDPPPGARTGTTQLPGVGTISVIRWADQTGGAQSMGDVVLAFVTQSPTDFAAAFDPAAPNQPVSPLAIGSTPLSQTLAQALVAGVIA